MTFTKSGVHSPLGILPNRIADSSSTNAVSFSSACTTKRFPSPRCASAVQIVRPLESITETQPQPNLSRVFDSFALSACVSERSTEVFHLRLLYLAVELERRVVVILHTDWRAEVHTKVEAVVGREK
jgi:hypothetical protein